MAGRGGVNNAGFVGCIEHGGKAPPALHMSRQHARTEKKKHTMVPYTTTSSGNREIEPSAWWASGQRSQHELECNHFRSVLRATFGRSSDKLRLIYNSICFSGTKLTTTFLLVDFWRTTLKRSRVD